VPGGERYLEAIGRRVAQPVDAIGPEVVVLVLLAVADHWRAGGLESLDGVADGILIQRLEVRMIAAFVGDGFDEGQRTRDAAYRLSWNHKLCTHW